MRPILHITDASVVGDHRIRLTFDDGVSKEVFAGDLLDGPIFLPLKDPEYFQLMQLDSRCGTVVWPNGADFAPEALWELEDLAVG
jgi:Protein of unknown function (DUF2442)